ncbi:uncharacterized protein FYW49_005059 [Xenentodon cancila]
MFGYQDQKEEDWNMKMLEDMDGTEENHIWRNLSATSWGMGQNKLAQVQLDQDFPGEKEGMGGKTTQPTAGLILNQVGYTAQQQVQMLGSELGLMEMTEVDYSHFQQFVQAHMETQAEPESRPHSATVISPLTSTQAIDLSTTCDEHHEVMSGEHTPVSYGEVPTFVLARINSEESQCEAPAKDGKPSEKHYRSTTRVCLEKRFNSMCADTRQQDIHSAVLSNVLTVFQQSAEVQEAVVQPQKKICVKPDKANSFEFSSNYVGGVFDPNMCGQVFAHMVEPNHHQGLIIPSFALNFHPESIITKTINSNSINPREEQQFVNTQRYLATPAAYKNSCSELSSQPTEAAKAAPESVRGSQRNSCKRAQSCMSLSLRRERHNIKERDRRKMIRLCCDELNTMVPFCDSNTDKVTTLQWTTAFLRYINKTYGDTFKEEFQKNFTQEKSIFLLSSSSSDKHPIHQKMNETLSIPLGAEQ